MLQIAQRAGIKDITCVYDDNTTELPTKQAMVNALYEVGTGCGPNDVLVFFYAGHGTNVPDTNGDEDDGLDEAFCTLDREGKFRYEDDALIDDDFAMAIHRAIPQRTRVLVLTDCCHS